jgi:nitrile hydratase accessory protein
LSQHDARAWLANSPELPLSPEGAPVFAEPWHAEAFAIAVHLNERGLFTWPEWAETLSAKLHQPGRCAGGSDYFDCWVEALSTLLERKGIADAATILSLQHSWQRAAEATPHGKSIELSNDPRR